MKTTNNLFIPIFFFLLFANCGGGSSEKKESIAPPPKSMVEEEPAALADPMDNKGVGPIKNVELGEIDLAMVEEGKQIYQNMCILCHKPDQKHIGPAPKGILGRRSPEWIMNMILNPEVMVMKTPLPNNCWPTSMAPHGQPKLNRRTSEKSIGILQNA